MAGLTRRPPDPQIVVVDNTRTEHVSRASTVHEHRAPTDASVALLKEMEAAAEKKLIESVYVGNAAFECVVHTEMDMASDCMRMRAVFKLNGKQETAEHSYRAYSGDTGEVHAWRELRNKIAEVIATRMIDGALSGRR